MAIDEMLERVRSLTARCGCRGPCESCMTMAVIAAEVRTLRARAEAAEQLVVWVARKGVMVGHDECVRPCIWFDVHRGVEYDGTPDSICRAVREARDGD